MRKTQRLRHWKQSFHPDAAFVWAKYTLYNGVQTIPGTAIPAELASKRNKVRRLWDAGFIKLTSFVAPDVTTGQIAVPEAKSAVPTMPEAKSAVPTMPEAKSAVPVDLNPDPLKNSSDNQEQHSTNAIRKAMFDGSK